MKGGNKQESPHGKVGDSVVDRLLLRYLSYRELYSMLKAILTHLVADDSLSKSLNEFHHLSRIPSLIHEPGRRAFCQQFLRSPLDLYQRAEKTVDMKGEQGGQSGRVPGQLRPSLSLLRVSINRCCGDGLFESVELGFKTFNPLFDVFEFLPPSVSAVHDSRVLAQYLVVLDECTHTAQGGLEGAKPIGGLFRNIEENLHAIYDSLLLC